MCAYSCATWNVHCRLSHLHFSNRLGTFPIPIRPSRTAWPTHLPFPFVSSKSKFVIVWGTHVWPQYWLVIGFRGAITRALVRNTFFFVSHFFRFISSAIFFPEKQWFVQNTSKHFFFFPSYPPLSLRIAYESHYSASQSHYFLFFSSFTPLAVVTILFFFYHCKQQIIKNTSSGFKKAKTVSYYPILCFTPTLHIHNSDIFLFHLHWPSRRIPTPHLLFIISITVGLT